MAQEPPAPPQHFHADCAADPDRERIARVLRKAWRDEDLGTLERDTERLMLYLAVEPYELDAPRQAPAPAPRRSLFRRVIGKPRR